MVYHQLIMNQESEQVGPGITFRVLGFAMFVATAFFTSIVDLTLGRAGMMPVQPTYLAIAVLSAFSLIVLLEAIRRRSLWRRLTTTIVSTAPQFACYLIIAISALLGAALPGAYWAENGKWVLLVPYGFLAWLTTLIISSDRYLLQSARSGVRLGFFLLAGSVIYEIFFPASFSNLEARASGFAGNSNFGALATCMLCAASLGYSKENARGRDLFYLALTAVAVLATQSRSGLAEFLIVLIFWCWSCLRDNAFSVREFLKLSAFIIVTLLLLGVVFSYILQESTLFSGEGNRFARLLSGKSIDDGSGDERVHAAMDAVRLIAEEPILGHGTGRTRTMQVLPHNLYLQQWVNNGLPGLLSYIFMLLTALFTFYRSRSFAGFTFVAVALVGSVFSHNVLDQRSFIMTFAILLAVRGSAVFEARESESLQ